MHGRHLFLLFSMTTVERIITSPCTADSFLLCAVVELLQSAVEDVPSAGEAKDLLRKAREAQKANTLPAL